MFFFLKPIKWAIKLASLVVFAAAIYVVVSGVQVARAEGGSVAPNSPTPAAIVVTGTPSSGTAGPSADLLGRLQHGLALYQSHAAPLLIVAGPSVASGPTVPDAAKTWLVGQGVPASAVTSLVTANGSEFDAVAKALGRGRAVIVVTDAVDALWAKDAASGAGLVVGVSPVPGTKAAVFTQLAPLFRQATGVAAGRVIGYGHASWAAS
jgi:hypothetical protein